MVTTLAAVEPAANGGGGGIGFLILVGLAVGLYYFLQVQWRPLNRCQKCPKPDEDGNTHRCRRCGGRSERLRTSAWVMMKCGIPVPRARHYDGKQHPMAVPKDYKRERD